MKAMVLNAPRELALGDVARPTVGPGQVLVRVTHTGVCGTDLKIFSGAIPVGYPRIMGHEMIGEVADAGDSDSVKVGDRVIVDPELFCGACFHCRIGQTHLCPKGQLLGRDANGGFADYLVAPASQVFRLPPSIESRTAPLIQVLTTCLHSQRLVNIFPGETVVVMGLGVTGQLHVQLAKARGARVIGVTRSQAKRELAQSLGADLTFAGGPDAIEKVREVTEGRGPDMIIETTGAMPALADSINMVRFGGRLLMFGIFTVTEGKLPFYQLYFKELALINGRVAKPEDYPNSIDLVERGQVRLAPLVSNVMPLGELPAAMGMLGSDDGTRMKIILENN